MSGELFIALDCEELPAGMVRPALEGLKKGLLGLLGGLTHGEVRTWATPRRLAVAVADVPAAQPLVEREITGPPARSAFKDGVPTKTAIGFAASKGVDVSELRLVELPKRGQVVAVTVREGGEATVDLVSEGMAEIISKVPFKKAMTWGAGSLSFGRPLHRVIALYDGSPIPGSAHGISFSSAAIGHRLDDVPQQVRSADEWVTELRAHHVEPDLGVRKARIRQLLGEAADQLEADPIVDEKLLEEVTHLVEWPTLVLARFDPDLLNLPQRLLITSMRVHQRYFPVHKNGELSHHFVVISNNPFGDAPLIAEGNARVLRARFYDARFFLKEDRSRSLAEHGTGLEGMRWIVGLGTMADKARRAADLAFSLAATFGANPQIAAQAGTLCKADLATQMVGEFPELQGHMGRLYAAGEGMPEAVGVAIEEHYLPRFADDAVASTPAGATLAVAERLDTLVACFGTGLKPKGGDPQGLRRAALGLVNTLLHHRVRIDLAEIFGIALHHVQAAVGLAHLAALTEWTASKGEAAPEGLPSSDALVGHCREVAAAHASWIHNAAALDLSDDERSAFDRIFTFGRWRKHRGVDTVARDGAEVVEALVSFALARFKASRVASGISADVVDAVLTASDDADLVVLDRKLEALVAVSGTEDFVPILVVFKRVLNITGDVHTERPDLSETTTDVERALLAATDTVEAAVSAAEADLDYGAALSAMLTLAGPVEAFFDGVMVMSKDETERRVRLGILGNVAAVFRRVADFGRISTR